MNSKAFEIYNSLLIDYPQALQSITKLSKNTTGNKNFIISDELAFNFDLINNLCKFHPDRKEKSPDALFYFKDVLYFVEFKEGDAKKEEIRLKIHEAIITLFQYASAKKIITKDEFFKLKIKYAVIMRGKVNGAPPVSFVNTLENSAQYFNLKNIEGLMIEKAKVIFQDRTIFELLNKISGGKVSAIKIANQAQDKIILIN